MADVVRQSHSWYAPGDPDNPRNNPDYINEVGNGIIPLHLAERVHLEELIGGDPWSVHEAVECMRRLGFVIDGKQGSKGYMLTGWKRPQRWTRLDGIYRSYMEPSLPLDVEP